MPQQPPVYSRSESDTPYSSDGGDNRDEDEMIPISIKAIREICAGIDHESLPEQLRELLGGREEGGNTNPTKLLATENQSEDRATGQITALEGQQTVHDSGTQGISAGVPKKLNAPHVAMGVLNSLVNLEAFATQIVARAQLRNRQGRQGLQSELSNTPYNQPKKGKAKEDQPQARHTRGQTSTEGNEKVRERDPKDRARDPKAPTAQKPRVILTRGTKMSGTRDPKPPRAPSSNRRPNRDAKEAQNAVPLKRKAVEIAGPSKQGNGSSARPAKDKGKEQPVMELNPGQFFEVSVQYDRCVDLAYNLGLQPDAVLQTIDEDNRVRKEEHLSKQAEQTAHQEGDDAQVRFDYTDTDDELDSREK